MRCIEMQVVGRIQIRYIMINRNMRCIEINMITSY